MILQVVLHGGDKKILEHRFQALPTMGIYAIKTLRYQGYRFHFQSQKIQ